MISADAAKKFVNTPRSNLLRIIESIIWSPRGSYPGDSKPLDLRREVERITANLICDRAAAESLVTLVLSAVLRISPPLFFSRRDEHVQLWL
jgi:hypothetical protein